MSWKKRRPFKVLRWIDLDFIEYRWENKKHPDNQVTREEFKYCFHKCEENPCIHFQVKIKKKYVKYNVICRISGTHNRRIKELNTQKHLTSAIGFKDCGK